MDWSALVVPGAMGVNCSASSPDSTCRFVARKSVPPNIRTPPVPAIAWVLRIVTRSILIRSPPIRTACPPV